MGVGVDIESIDGKGNTPLMLGIIRNKGSICEEILKQGADPSYPPNSTYSPIPLAIAQGNLPLLKLLLRYNILRKMHVWNSFGDKKLAGTLRGMPDFDVNLEWKCHSIIPLLARMGPSDIYRIYKRADTLRIDFTLDPFTNIRANLSILYKGIYIYIYTLYLLGRGHSLLLLDHSKGIIREVLSPPSDIEIEEMAKVNNIQHNRDIGFVEQEDSWKFKRRVSCEQDRTEAKQMFPKELLY